MLTDYFSKFELAWLASKEEEGSSLFSRALIPLVTQVRIRRNLAGFPFPNKCGSSQLFDVAALLLSRMGDSDAWRRVDSRMIDNLDEVSKNLLLEKRLISQAFAKGGPGRFVARDDDGIFSCMINEADHLSITAFLGGLDLHASHEFVSALDKALGLSYAEDAVLGYLTADPSMVGTGMQASVLLHLPALDFTDAIKGAIRAMEGDWARVSLRKIAPCGGSPAGSFYLIANKVTLFVSPAEILSMLQGASELLVSKELSARRGLKANRNEAVIDQFWRSWGTLRHARRLSVEEAMRLLSFVKLGSELGYLPCLRDDEWKHMIIASQPCHLNAEAQSIIEKLEELSLRAALFRRFIENRSTA